MKKGVLGSLAALLAGAGMALAQPPEEEVLPPPRPGTVTTPQPGPGPELLPPPRQRPGVPVYPIIPADQAGQGPASGVPEFPIDAATPDGGAGCEAGCSYYDYGGKLWFRGEYLMWWIRAGRLPPLVTTGSLDSQGVFGAPGTEVLFGGTSVNNEERSGGRFTLGWWLSYYRDVGIDASYFFLGSRSVNFGASGGEDPNSVLARPIFDVLAGTETSVFVAFPGLVSGRIDIELSSRLQGADVNVLANFWDSTACGPCGCRVDLLTGFRFAQLDEGLNITQAQVVDASAPALAGANIALADLFGTQNRFYGWQVGARLNWARGRWGLDLSSKVAIGSMRQVVDIDGFTFITPAGGLPAALGGGVLAQPTNIGSYERNQFAFALDAGANVSYQLCGGTRVFVGYTFFALTDIVRPADQIDRAVNVSLVPTLAPPVGVRSGPALPTFRFDETDFWAQGFSAGLEFRY